VFLGAKSEGIDVDTGIGGAGVSLERLYLVEVSTLTLREAVLAVKLKLGNNYRVKTPAVHVKGALGKNESSGIGYTGDVCGFEFTVSSTIGLGAVRVSTSRGSVDIRSSWVLEKTRGVDVVVGACDSSLTTVSMESVGESIDGISIVERLGTEGLVKKATSLEGSTVINVRVRLDNPDKLLTRVVEVKTDLVGRRTDRFITCELKLLNQVLMRVLCHSAALISIQEDVVNIKRSSYEGLVVSSSGLGGTGGKG